MRRARTRRVFISPNTDEEFAAAERRRDRERYRRKKEREAELLELKRITFPFGAFVAPGSLPGGGEEKEESAVN
jgi:hypothetical protein